MSFIVGLQRSTVRTVLLVGIESIIFVRALGFLCLSGNMSVLLLARNSYVVQLAVLCKKRAAPSRPNCEIPRGLQIVGEMSIVAGPLNVTTRVVKFSAETHTTAPLSLSRLASGHAIYLRSLCGFRGNHEAWLNVNSCMHFRLRTVIPMVKVINSS